jgi:hypothetical protein
MMPGRAIAWHSCHCEIASHSLIRHLPISVFASDEMEIGRVQVGQLHILQRDHILRIVRDYNV